MTTKRINGRCHGTSGGCSPDSMGMVAHTASCPSLYPAQQEPDALTRLCKLVRHRWTTNADDRTITDVLDLISEAREEQRRAIVRAKNDGLERAAMWSTTNAPSHGLAMVLSLRAMKDPEP